VTANLLFSQALYQTKQPEIARGMLEVSVQNGSAVSKSNDDSSGDSLESFLNTFEHISKEHKPNKKIEGAGDETSSTFPAYNSGDKFDAIFHPAPGLEIGISEATKQSEEDFDNVASVQTGNSASHNAVNSLGQLSESGSTEPVDLNKPAENFEGASRLENGAEADSIKLAAAARPLGVETTSNTKKISREPQSAGDTVRDNTVNTESSPVSKMIHDAQLAKENHMKMNAAMIDELGEKVTKVDAATNDNGLLNSQNQTTEKAFEATSFSKQTEVGHDNLRTQTLDQIVKRAVIHVKNGQHEAKIDLKPDFLGHVRMQVTTVDQQVTVKILTELSIVKDMIENNIHQLKADLQQQGLNVDKLEVSVSHDSDKYGDTRQNADRAKDRLRNTDPKNPENPKIETPEQAGNFGLRTAGGSTVDYFA